MMRAIGELLYADPDNNSFVAFVKVLRSWGLGTSWVGHTGLHWILPAMAELTAIGLYVQYWLPNVPAVVETS